MNRLPLALLLLALALPCGCRSSTERPKRDYLSANRSSFAFLKDTAKHASVLRKENLRRDFQDGDRLHSNLAQQSQGRKFAAQSFFGKPVSEMKIMLSDTGEMLHDEVKTTPSSMRFGFLDSGE